VIGAGSWGTALAFLLARKGHCIQLVGRNHSTQENLIKYKENIQYLQGFVLPDSVNFSPLEKISALSDCYVIAVPSDKVHDVLQYLPKKDALIVIASKGLIEGPLVFLSRLVQSELSYSKIAVLSGPNLAVELAREVPSAAVAASSDSETSKKVASIFRTSYYRVYTNLDIIGVELAGALKNIYAIGAGLSDGLEFGDNTKATLLARGLHEMTRLGVLMGAKIETFMGVAGVGDLFATASSKLSRNYRVGYALGKGKSLDQTLQDIGQVAEGIRTSKIALNVSKIHGVSMPILEVIESILYKNLPARKAVEVLMERHPKHEGFAFIDESCKSDMVH